MVNVEREVNTISTLRRLAEKKNGETITGTVQN